MQNRVNAFAVLYVSFKYAAVDEVVTEGVRAALSAGLQGPTTAAVWLSPEAIARGWAHPTTLPFLDARVVRDWRTPAPPGHLNAPRRRATARRTTEQLTRGPMRPAPVDHAAMDAAGRTRRHAHPHGGTCGPRRRRPGATGVPRSLRAAGPEATRHWRVSGYCKMRRSTERSDGHCHTAPSSECAASFSLSRAVFCR